MKVTINVTLLFKWLERGCFSSQSHSGTHTVFLLCSCLILKYSVLFCKWQGVVSEAEHLHCPSTDHNLDICPSCCECSCFCACWSSNCGTAWLSFLISFLPETTQFRRGQIFIGCQAQVGSGSGSYGVSHRTMIPISNVSHICFLSVHVLVNSSCSYTLSRLQTVPKEPLWV